MTRLLQFRLKRQLLQPGEHVGVTDKVRAEHCGANAVLPSSASNGAEKAGDGMLGRSVLGHATNMPNACVGAQQEQASITAVLFASGVELVGPVSR